MIFNNTDLTPQQANQADETFSSKVNMTQYPQQETVRRSSRQSSATESALISRNNLRNAYSSDSDSSPIAKKSDKYRRSERKRKKAA